MIPSMRTRARAEIVAVFVVGLLMGAALTATATDPIPFDRLEAFSHALSIIHARYVDERDPDELVYDAIGGLTQGLDDHSVFLAPDAYREMLEQTSGEYYGVGVQTESRSGRIFVLAVSEGSPAADAGLEPGDEIVSVDGTALSPDNASAVLGQVRGPRGTMVLLGVTRGEERMELAMRRDQVRTRSVHGRLIGHGVGWLRISRFQKRTVDEVSELLGQLKDERGGPLSGLIIDLRDNPGGYLRQAVAVADLWVADGTIVSTVDRGAASQEDRAQTAGTDIETPLVVLINGGSASAAEILAGALQDLQRASLVGYTSYGKGSVQQFFELADGSALKLTTARYLTPSGRFIHGSGIEPDVALGAAGTPFDAERLAPLFDLHPTTADEVAADPELHAAWALLRDPAGTRAWFAERAPEVEAAAPN